MLRHNGTTSDVDVTDTPGHVAVPRDLAVNPWVQDAALVQYTRLTVNF